MSRKKRRNSPGNSVARPQQSGPVRATQFAVTYSGPLPPPAMMEQYGELIPNGPERLMVLVENQSAHRLRMEEHALKHDTRRAYMGVVFAFLLGMTAILVGGYTAISGHPWFGSAVTLGGLGGIITTFIYGTSSRAHERESRMRNMLGKR